MRCPDCNKFVGMDTEDPDVDSIDVTLTDETTAEVSANVIIRRNCAECGTQLKEGNIDICDSFTVDTGHDTEGHELSVEEGEVSGTERTEGKGRGMRTYLGAEIHFKITCSCGKLEYQDVIKDDVQASAFEEVV